MKNKRMREILASIEKLRGEAKSLKEEKKFDDATAKLAEISDLQKEYEVEKALFEAEQEKVPDEPATKSSKLTDEEKAFVAYCRSVQTEKTLSLGSNGAIVPDSIANKIIEAVKELSPIYAKATIYNAKGVLSIPYYGADSSDDVQAAYATEFTDLTAHQGKFTSVDLSALTIGALAKISKSLINNTDVDVLNFIVQKVAKALADFIEKELLVGTGASGHMTGATTTTNVNTLTTKTVAGHTADVLIDTQLMVPEVYQANACWIMNKDVFKAVRKLKDTEGDYILTKNFAEGFGWMLLGKPVYISENMPAVAASSVSVLYGDFSGMACKLAKNVEIQVLNELYAAQHAVGVVGWVEVDSKIENSQKFVGIKNSAA